jgi:predicted flap endonuclease-1-like 5' DNA nuclease
MSHYLLELALWLTGFYFVGCLLGSFLRGVIAPQAVTAPAISTVGGAVAEAAVAVHEPMPLARDPAATTRAVRPTGIAAARQGGPDDLQRISGVGPVIERTLHGLGFYHFDQVAGWTAGEVAWVSAHLNFPGRIEREEWVAQARLLAAGDEGTFARLYGTGGLKRNDGETHAGSRTRRSPSDTKKR